LKKAKKEKFYSIEQYQARKRKIVIRSLLAVFITVAIVGFIMMAVGTDYSIVSLVGVVLMLVGIIPFAIILIVIIKTPF